MWRRTAQQDRGGRGRETKMQGREKRRDEGEAM
jgi:hypothetical protein